MKQKTAMQEMIESLRGALLIESLSETEGNLKQFLFAAIRDAEKLKATTEREQIYQAFVAGDERGTGEIPFNCEQYYQQKYGDEK